jgi:hypothetical protein
MVFPQNTVAAGLGCELAPQTLSPDIDILLPQVFGLQAPAFLLETWVIRLRQLGASV